MSVFPHASSFEVPEGITAEEVAQAIQNGMQELPQPSQGGLVAFCVMNEKDEPAHAWQIDLEKRNVTPGVHPSDACLLIAQRRLHGLFAGTDDWEQAFSDGDVVLEGDGAVVRAFSELLVKLGED